MMRSTRAIALLFLSTSCFAQYVAIPFTHSVSGGGGALTFVGSSSGCSFTSGTTCNVTVSIPSGDHIVVGIGTDAYAGVPTLSASDSNFDTFQCAPSVVEATDNSYARVCVTIASASITTITCNASLSGNAGCAVEWFSGGASTISGTPCSSGTPIDQCAQADNPNVSVYNSGTTSTLSQGTETVIGFFAAPNSVNTWSSSDGTIRQSVNTGTNSFAIEDRNVSSTSGVAASANSSPAPSYGTASVITIR